MSLFSTLALTVLVWCSRVTSDEFDGEVHVLGVFYNKGPTCSYLHSFSLCSDWSHCRLCRSLCSGWICALKLCVRKMCMFVFNHCATETFFLRSLLAQKTCVPTPSPVLIGVGWMSDLYSMLMFANPYLSWQVGMVVEVNLLKYYYAY